MKFIRDWFMKDSQYSWLIISVMLLGISVVGMAQIVSELGGK